MLNAPSHPQEETRINALKDLEILDTPPEEHFDGITRLAALICGTPIALFSLVDRDRVWFKSRYGFESQQSAPKSFLCAHTILNKNATLVPDPTRDDRCLDGSPLEGSLVTSAGKMQFYAGWPVYDPIHRLPIGSLCVIDHRARQLTHEQLEGLKTLRDQIQRHLLARRRIQETERAETTIREINQRQEFILEGAGLGAWDWWLDTNKVHFDRRWCEMLGLDPETTPQTLSTWSERVHPDDLSQTYADVRSYLDGRTPIYENVHRVRHANGDWIWILDRGRVSERTATGQPLRFTGTHFDITSHQKNELMLKEIQRAARIGGWELDLETQTTKWSDEVYRIHEIPIGTPTNKIMGLNFYPPSERPRISKCVQLCAQEGITYREIFEFYDAKGTRKWVETSGEPVRNAEGRITALRGVFQDVTERIESERAAESARLKAIHASKLASLGEMSAGIAHEINNPLAIMATGLDTLTLLRDDKAHFDRHVEILHRAIERISKIIRGLRRFSRSTDELKLQIHPLHDILRDALEIIATKAKQNGVPIEIEASPETWVEGDAIELEQVIINLISNAIDAAKPSAGGWVRVRCFPEGPQAVLQVEDSGPGLSSDHEGRIFEPFFTTKPVGQGVGLGLSISKGIVESHKGNLTYSRQGNTTRFEVRLPLQTRSSSGQFVA